MSIEYTAYTWQGRKVSGVVDAATVEDVFLLLERDQLFPYKVKEVVPRRSVAEVFPGLFKPKPRDLVDFSRQLASLLKSGVPLRRALLTLKDESSSQGLRLALKGTLADIESGVRFSDALERHTTVFPEYYVRLVRVGEAAGGLSHTLERLADTLQQRKSVQDKIRAALIYPAISLVVAIVAGIVLVTYSLPALIGLLDEFGGELPFATQLLQDATMFMRSYVGLVFAGLIGTAFALYFYTRTPSGARQRDRLLLRVPIVGSVLLRSSMFSLTATLKTLIGAGVPLVEALRLSREAVGNIPIREALEQATEDASGGTSLGQAFRNQKQFPSLLTQGIVTGELSGTLGETLDGLTDFYQQESERAVGAATELIQPAIILFVAAVVGFISVAVISGIYSTLGTVNR